MHLRNRKEIRRLLHGSAIAMLLASGTVAAADDPSIKGDLRSNVQSAMKEMIQQRTVGGVFKYYDSVNNRLLDLKLVELHDGIVKKGDYYVSCADFVDSKGTAIDMDFLVLPGEEKLIATQAVLHKIAGKKRKYHLEQ